MVPIGWPSHPQLGLISQTSSYWDNWGKGMYTPHSDSEQSTIHFYQSLLQLYQVKMCHSLDPLFCQQLSCQQEWLFSPVVFICDYSGVTHSWSLLDIHCLKRFAFLSELKPLRKVKPYIALVLCCPSTQSLTYLAFYMWVAETASRRCHIQVSILSSSLGNILWPSWLNIFAYFMPVLHC